MLLLLLCRLIAPPLLPLLRSAGGLLLLGAACWAWRCVTGLLLGVLALLLLVR